MIDTLVILVALVFSAFFSASETSFITFDKLKVVIWEKNKDFFISTIKIFSKHSDRVIITCLIGNNLANVAYSSLAAIYLSYMGFSVVYVIIISTLIILTFGEIIPKALALSLNNSFVRPFSVLLAIVYAIFYPIVFGLSFLNKLFFPHSNQRFQPLLNRSSLRKLVKSPHVDIEPEDAALAESVLSFASSKMREIMTPRPDIVSAHIDTKIEDITKLILDTGHSKIVIFNEDIDHIAGYIHSLDLMTSVQCIREILRPPIFVSEFTPVIDGLKIIKKNQTGLLFVLDEYGGIDGIVTIEDIAEEIFGEIEDEYDRPVFRHRETAPGKYIFSGRAEIDDINKSYEFDLEKEEGVETIGGWLVTKLGRIPKRKEIIEIDGFRIEVILSDSVRVKMLRLEKS